MDRNLTSHRNDHGGRRLVVTLLSTVLALVGCVSDSNTQADSASISDEPAVSDASTVQRFAQLLASGVDLDYTPLASPAAAVDTADLIIIGRIASISEGIKIATPGEGGAVALWMATMRVKVDEVIAGSSDQGALIIQTFIEPGTGIEALAHSVPNGPAVFVLDDITAWRPFDDAQFSYPDGISKGTQLYTPYTDGIWFDTTGGLRGVAVSADEIRQRWAGADTFTGMVELLRMAAAQEREAR